jgi:hypothetical protein
VTVANRTSRQIPFPILPLSVKDIMARLANQADRPPLRSPPFVSPASIVGKLQGPTKPRASSQQRGPMTSALANAVTRLEIHAIYDEAANSEKDQTLKDGTTLYLKTTFNPASLEHTIKPKYVEHAVPGLSFERTHYTGTPNQMFKFDLLLDYQVELYHLPSAGPSGNTPARSGQQSQAGTFPDAYVEKVGDAYKFLQSLAYPKEGADGPAQLHPPEVLVFWPNLISLHCVLWDLSAKWQKVLPTGELASVMVSLTFKEIPKQRISMEDIRYKGALRSEGKIAADINRSSSNIG